MRCNLIVTLLIAAGVLSLFGPAAVPALAQPAEVRTRIEAAAPDKPLVQPAQPRRLLVFSGTKGFRHKSIPVGVLALKTLGKQTGAFQVIHSEDIAVFEPQTLRQFDAVCLLNSTGELFMPREMGELQSLERLAALDRDRELKQSFQDFLASGKGLIGIHAATDCFYQWDEYGQTIGAYFDGHPWHEKVAIRVEDPAHPLTAAFGRG
ncbi:MAG: ThuA domain-containing protein, partial [Planctomycetes bacterium]|nr:ThuA domain-containing protein [Planctomycetota bacterium]